ncbi:MAG: helix-turn-helix transcriptional regulator [Dehalococcoidales bacterium]|nr:helix-turn-helix transcriptional regulator [Dehalococcoidales bacterium]
MTYIRQETRNLCDFGRKLIVYRESAGMSRNVLAGSANVSPEHIWRLENSFRGCSRDLAIIIGRVLNLKIEQINELLILAGHRPMRKKGGFSENRLENR